MQSSAGGSRLALMVHNTEQMAETPKCRVTSRLRLPAAGTELHEHCNVTSTWEQKQLHTRNKSQHQVTPPHTPPRTGEGRRRLPVSAACTSVLCSSRRNLRETAGQSGCGGGSTWGQGRPPPTHLAPLRSSCPSVRRKS